MRPKYRLVLITSLVFLCFVGMGWSVYRASNLPLLVVDMKKLLNEPAVLLSRSSLAPKDQKRILSAYSRLLPQSIADYGKAHRATLIATTVLYADALDATDDVMNATLERLKHEA